MKCSVLLQGCKFRFQRASLQGLEDARISLIGDIESVEGEALGLAKEAYRKRHPDSFWIDFGDFSMWKMSPKSGRLIGGFARAGQVELTPC